MKYKLTVIKYEKNENYEAEMAKYKEDNRNGYFSQRNGLDLEAPHTEIAARSLEVFLTEEEYKKVKSEVIKIFE